MSDRPIKAGDLVMVVKALPCCGSAAAVGTIFKVESFGGRGRCVYCKAVRIVTTARRENGFVYELSRLIRIDPPATGDSLPTRKDIEEHV